MKFMFFDVFYFILLVCQKNIIYSLKSTECQKMYLNSTINIPCIEFNSCCIIEYEFYSKNFTNCILYDRNLKNICSIMDDNISYYYGTMKNCNCFSEKFQINLKIIIGVFLFIIFENIKI